MNNRVKIVDYFSIHSFHEIINTALVIMCTHLFDDVQYYAGKSSIKNIKKYYYSHIGDGASSIIFHRRPICEANTKLGTFIRTILGFFVTIAEYIFLGKKTILFFNYTNPLSMPLILFLNYLLKKKVVFVMHGELELQLKQNISILKPAFWYRLFHRLSLKHLFKRNEAILLVLGESIKSNLCDIFPAISSNIYSICHPYFMDDCIINKKQRVLTIGTVGVMTKEKGLDSLLILSEKLSNPIKEGKLIIKAIGKVETVDVSIYRNIKWIGNKNLLPRDIFEEAIQSLDYILYLYPSDSYKLTASGAIMDAVKFGKPILALHNDYFDYLLKNVCIGYVVNDIYELITIINQLLKTTVEIDYSEGFNLLRNKVSIRENTILLEKILKDRMYIA